MATGFPFLTGHLLNPPLIVHRVPWGAMKPYLPYFFMALPLRYLLQEPQQISSNATICLLLITSNRISPCVHRHGTSDGRKHPQVQSGSNTCQKYGHIQPRVMMNTYNQLIKRTFVSCLGSFPGWGDRRDEFRSSGSGATPSPCPELQGAAQVVWRKEIKDGFCNF